MKMRKISALGIMFGFCLLLGGCVRGLGEGINDGVSGGVSTVIEDLIVNTVGSFLPSAE